MKSVIIPLAFFLIVPSIVYAEPPENYSPPLICIQEFPDDDSVSDIKKKMYAKEIRAGITEWVNMIKEQSTFPRSENWKWDFDIQNVVSPSNCSVNVQFLSEPTADNSERVLGQYFPDTNLINLYYYTPYKCETHRDSSYIYYGTCRSSIDLATTDELGSIFKHEFGHALGLQHDKSETSLMNAIYQQVPYKGRITPYDVDKVIDMYPNGFFSEVQSQTNSDYFQESNLQIPQWVRNNALWWSEDQIDDTTFVTGIKYLIDHDILNITQTVKTSSYVTEIPAWIKTNAGWWAAGEINDELFVSGIQYLIQEGLM